MRKSKVDGVGYTLDGVKLGIAALNMLQSLRSGPEGTRGRNLVTIIKVDDF